MFADGIEYYKSGKYRDAYAQFRASWALYKHNGTAANLADCEMRLGKTRDAAEHFAYVLRMQPADASDRPAIESAYQTALRSVGTIHVSAPAGADIRVDGAIIGKAPLEDPVFVDPGEHEIGMILGSTSATEGVRIQAGQAKDLSLSPKATALPDDPTPAPGDQSSTSSKLSPIIPVGLGLGVVGIGLGVGFTVAANGKAGDRDSLLASINHDGAEKNVCGVGSIHSKECAAAQDLHDSRTSLQTGAIIGYSLGAAALIGTSVYWIFSSKPDRPVTSKLQLIPSVGSRYSGADLIGNF